MVGSLIQTPLGAMFAGTAENGALARLDFLAYRDDPEALYRRLGVHEWRPPQPAVESQVQAFFSGELRGFDLPLAPAGTAFQLRVWDQLRRIPYGETISYGELSRRCTGDAKASRAVGAANGANPISLIVPCHRVIGASGALVGYGGGLPLKKWLLDFERSQSGLFAAAPYR